MENSSSFYKIMDIIQSRLFIEMIEITKDYFPEKEGKYLVRTVSDFLKTVHYMDATVSINGNKYSIGINNQTATHISKECL